MQGKDEFPLGQQLATEDEHLANHRQRGSISYNSNDTSFAEDNQQVTSSEQWKQEIVNHYLNDYDLTSVEDQTRFLKKLPQQPEPLWELFNIDYSGITLPSYLTTLGQQPLLDKIFKRIAAHKQWPSTNKAERLSQLQWAVVCNQLSFFAQLPERQCKDLFLELCPFEQPKAKQSPLFLALYHNHYRLLFNLLYSYIQINSSETSSDEDEEINAFNELEMDEYFDAVINKALDANRFGSATLLIRLIEEECRDDNILNTPAFLPVLANLKEVVPAHHYNEIMEIIKIEEEHQLKAVNIDDLDYFCQNYSTYQFRVWLISALNNETTSKDDVFWQKVCNRMVAFQPNLQSLQEVEQKQRVQEEWYSAWYLLLEYTFRAKNYNQTAWSICAQYAQQQLITTKLVQQDDYGLNCMVKHAIKFKNHILRSFIYQWADRQPVAVRSTKQSLLFKFFVDKAKETDASASEAEEDAATKFNC